MSLMGEQRFEYVSVRLGLAMNQEKMTERINSVAEHGWRLVQVINGRNGTDQLVFERPISE